MAKAGGLARPQGGTVSDETGCMIGCARLKFNHPKFAEKLKEVVGLYIDSLSPLWRSSMRSQIQALARHPAGSADEKGRCATMTLVTATVRQPCSPLSISLKAIIVPHEHHRRQEFIRFSRPPVPNSRACRAPMSVLDNYAAHKHPKVRSGSHAIHASPSTSRRLRVLGGNAVEGWFARLTGNASSVASSPRSSSYRPPHFIADANDKPEPSCPGTNSADAILAAVQRGRRAQGTSKGLEHGTRGMVICSPATVRDNWGLLRPHRASARFTGLILRTHYPRLGNARDGGAL